MHNGFGNARWVRAGNIDVDSGTVMVVDPCYVLRDHRDEGEPDNGMEYFDALGLNLDADDPRSPNNQHKSIAKGDLSVTQLPGLNGFVLPSGYGDGSYPIWAKLSDEGEWGTRVAGIYIDFQLGMEDMDEDDVEDETEGIS